MIYGKITDLKRYAPLSPAFEAAQKFVEEYMSEPKADGSYELIPGLLTASVATNELGEAGDKLFEAHRAYADIQVVLKGEERIDCADIAGCTDMVSEEFSKGGDIAFYKDPEIVSSLVLGAGMFTVLYPEDAHKPCVKTGEGAQIATKVVFKVKL